MSAVMQGDKQFAIIGFWEKNKFTKLFQCENYFYVPNPEIQEVRKAGEKKTLY